MSDTAPWRITGREREARRAALADRAVELGLHALVVTDPRDLEYLTGYAGTSTLGPNPFFGAVGTALVLSAEGLAVLVVGQPDDRVLVLDAGDVTVFAAETFTDLSPLRPAQRLAGAVAEVLSGTIPSVRSRIGHQPSTLPAQALASAVGEPSLVGVELEVVRLRMCKSPAELAAIRRAVAVCDHAQLVVHRDARPGMREADLLALVHDAVVAQTGDEVPLVSEVFFGDGSDRPLHEGDVLLADIAPRVDGYWGDSCDTRPIGEADGEARRAFAVAREALQAGTDVIRPGLQAGALDATMQAVVSRSHPAYTGSGGHGVGLDFHEAPRLIPDERTTLQPGMVLALEPGIYLPQTTVRFEHLVHVVPGGCEVLSTHLLDGDRP